MIIQSKLALKKRKENQLTFNQGISNESVEKTKLYRQQKDKTLHSC